MVAPGALVMDQAPLCLVLYNHRMLYGFLKLFCIATQGHAEWKRLITTDPNYCSTDGMKPLLALPSHNWGDSGAMILNFISIPTNEHCGPDFPPLAQEDLGFSICSPQPEVLILQ